LPNPHYDSQLKALTGKDAAVAQWLDGFKDVGQMIDHIENFVRTWLPRYTEDTRNYLTIAIGCTGGKHRSVYVVESLAKRFNTLSNVQIRHRNQPEWA
ncbi:MAG: RNase adaptor protein RapZ, partial [Burkholderiaceae bacterium]|nr:RNase adaptor protein RapZ [Burkholderiaceae bacterium]